ncbi:MAG: Resolvase domain protein [Subtercola sp.]|nr:Resolvase domain protein [Subtercola sp.]
MSMSTTSENGPKQAIAYLRVSTPRQTHTSMDIDPEGNSIATQRSSNLIKADALGVPIIREFIEPGQSAQTISKRPIFKELLRFIEEHGDEVSHVIIYSRSRAFRNMFDAFIVEQQLQERGIQLVSATEDFGEDEDMATMSKVLTDMMNHFQVRNNGKDIKVKLYNKASKGGTVFKAPVGYINQPVLVDGYKVNSVVVDEERAPLVKRIFEQYATGEHSIAQLQAKAADQGLTTRPTRRWPTQPIAEVTLTAMLKDPYYAGYVVFKGDIFPGRHEPLVSRELFQRVQEVMAERTKTGTRDRILTHYLKGLLYCERCRSKGVKSRLIYTEARGNNGETYKYFLCRARQDKACNLPYLPVSSVETSITSHTARLALPTNFVDDIRTQVERTVENEAALVTETKHNLEQELAKLEREEDRLLDLLSDVTLNSEKLKSRLRKLSVRRDSIRTQLHETSNGIAQGVQSLDLYLRLLADPHQFYETSTNSTRRKLLETFFRSIWLDDDEQVTSQMTERVEAVHRAATVTQTNGISGRNQKSPAAYSEALALPKTDQLEQNPNRWAFFSSKAVMVGPVGLEPTTHGLKVRCSTN